MTALRPERAPGGAEPSSQASASSSAPSSSYPYESTGEFAAVVEGLVDPLNDPLPGHGNPSPPSPSPAAERTTEGSPWFRPQHEPHEPEPQGHQQPQGHQAGAYGAGAGASVDVPGLPREWQQGATDFGAYGHAQPQHQQQERAEDLPGTGQAQQQPYEAAYEPWAPAAAPGPGDGIPGALGPQPPPPPGTSQEPPLAPSRAGGRRRAADGGETTVMRALDPDPGDTPGETADRAPEAPQTPQPGRAARRRAAAAAAGGATAVGATAVGAAAVGTEGVAGGRAARRKAAQQASRRGGRRARGHAAPSGPGAAESAAASDALAAPLSRVEARRAARAAKESPGVVASRIAGELFITFGVLMLLFVTYQLWWSNILAHQEAGGAANSLQSQWNSGNGDRNATFSDGQNFAIIYIPKLDVKAPIAQGVSKPKVLDKGMVGHYDGAPFDTAMPWAKTGNFALAAHRNTHGEPFRYINKLVKGDKVVVETENTYYTYEITSTLPQTSPSNVSVIEPIPTGSGFTKAGRYITLTTCTPEFTSTYRLIVWGRLVSEQPRSKGTPAVLQGG